MKKLSKAELYVSFLAMLCVVCNGIFVIVNGTSSMFLSIFSMIFILLVCLSRAFQSYEFKGLDPILRVNAKKKWTIIEYSIDKDKFGQDIIMYRALRNGKKVDYARSTNFEKLKTAILYAEKYGTDKVFNDCYVTVDEKVELLKFERIKDKNKKRENYYIKTKKPIWP